MTRKMSKKEVLLQRTWLLHWSLFPIFTATQTASHQELAERVRESNCMSEGFGWSSVRVSVFVPLWCTGRESGSEAAGFLLEREEFVFDSADEYNCRGCTWLHSSMPGGMRWKTMLRFIMDIMVPFQVLTVDSSSSHVYVVSLSHSGLASPSLALTCSGT